MGGATIRCTPRQRGALGRFPTPKARLLAVSRAPFAGPPTVRLTESAGLGRAWVVGHVLSNTSQAKGAVIAVVISEKGGAERREAFEHAEITIGRVQGNDLMLPKGNVSKRHARLVFRDGRFIVTDLNSTNGTYVNRRRISQATIVRQGDRIYIGDFVLRVDSAEEGAQARGTPSSPIPLREPMLTNPDGAARSKPPPAPPPPPHSYPPVPPAPRVPTTPERSAPSHASPSTTSDPLVAERRPTSTRDESIDAETAAYRGALSALVTRVTEKLEPGLLDRDITAPVTARAERAIDDALADLRRDGGIGAAIIDQKLKHDARAELLELGALGPLMQDETLSEIAVAGLGPIVAMRGGQRTLVEPPFSSEASLARVLGRLARQCGSPLGAGESVVSRRHPSGLSLSAVTGASAPSGTLLRLERKQRVDVTLDDLVRSGVLSRAMATFFRHCVGVKGNILIAGPREARPTAIAAALVSAAGDGHVIALQDAELIVSSAVNVTHIDTAQAEDRLPDLVDFAGRFPDARWVVGSFSGKTALAALDTVASGADGLIAVSNSTSLRRTLSRLPAELSAARGGLTAEAAREWVASTFDILIEVIRLRDGRQRIVRVAEPTTTNGEIGLRDVFTFVIERTATGGSVEGTFQATGVAPRVVGDMVARGISVDSGVFSRPPSR